MPPDRVPGSATAVPCAGQLGRFALHHCQPGRGQLAAGVRSHPCASRHPAVTDNLGKRRLSGGLLMLKPQNDGGGAILAEPCDHRLGIIGI